MTPTILGLDYATRIRSRLGVTDSVLSTTEIDESLTDIELDYIDLVPDYASKTGKDKTRLASSVVCMTASALCSVVKSKFATRIAGPNGSFERPIDWDAKAVELKTEANRLLSLVKPPVVYSHFQIRG